jgi:hypothetical protein
MTTQHTPGPWEVKRQINGEDFYIADGPNFDVCEIIVGHARSQEAAEANARLIAAAPDMLEFLQALNRIGGLGLDVHRQLDALIAKATGEQP